MEFVTTTRGARSHIFEGYMYVINMRGQNEVSFGDVKRPAVVVEV